jgi:hypothetical protein
MCRQQDRRGSPLVGSMNPCCSVFFRGRSPVVFRVASVHRHTTPVSEVVASKNTPPAGCG